MIDTITEKNIINLNTRICENTPVSFNILFLPKFIYKITYRMFEVSNFHPKYSRFFLHAEQTINYVLIKPRYIVELVGIFRTNPYLER